MTLSTRMVNINVSSPVYLPLSIQRSPMWGKTPHYTLVLWPVLNRHTPDHEECYPSHPYKWHSFSASQYHRFWYTTSKMVLALKELVIVFKMCFYFLISLPTTVIFLYKLVFYNEYLASSADTNGLELYHLGISSHSAKYTNMCFQWPLLLTWFNFYSQHG